MTRYRVNCEAYRVRFCVGSDCSDLLELALLEAPFGCMIQNEDVPTAPEYFLQRKQGSAFCRLLLEGESITEWLDADRVLARLRGELMVYVANLAPDFVFLHAGVVGWHGSAFVLPGTSFAGKSTLVGALVRAGATYYSDEYAVVDDAGRIHPYARDLQMRQIGGLDQHAVSVAELGGQSGTDPLRLGSVVFCQYARNAVWSPKPVSPGMAVLEMLTHAIPVQRTPGRVMSVLAKMMTGATSMRTERGEAADAARRILGLCDPTDCGPGTGKSPQ